jgi:2-iminobutanoate/2-iminopropanoate deaminase
MISSEAVKPAYGLAIAASNTGRLQAPDAAIVRRDNRARHWSDYGLWGMPSVPAAGLICTGLAPLAGAGSCRNEIPETRTEEAVMARSSIYVGEIAHQSPIPNASRIGNIIVSGLIRGADPATAKLAATLEQQCAFMFLHMRQAVEAGGATVEDIIKVTVWMKELQRKPVNDEWVKMFPDPASRPARQIMEVPMEAGVLVQCDFMAVIES